MIAHDTFLLIALEKAPKLTQYLLQGAPLLTLDLTLPDHCDPPACIGKSASISLVAFDVSGNL